jgi:hypothetical protein
MASSSFFRKNGARCVGIGAVSIGSGRQEIEEVLALYRQSEGLPSPRKSTMCLGALLGRCILKKCNRPKMRFIFASFPSTLLPLPHLIIIFACQACKGLRSFGRLILRSTPFYPPSHKNSLLLKQGKEV